MLIRAERNTFALVGDLLDLADRVSKDFIPMAKDDKVGASCDAVNLTFNLAGLECMAIVGLCISMSFSLPACSCR